MGVVIAHDHRKFGGKIAVADKTTPIYRMQCAGASDSCQQNFGLRRFFDVYLDLPTQLPVLVSLS